MNTDTIARSQQRSVIRELALSGLAVMMRSQLPIGYIIRKIIKKACQCQKSYNSLWIYL